MYEVGTGAEVRAFHVMPGMEGPEGQLHSHDYRLDVTVGSSALDERGMVCDLDVLDAALTQITDRLRDADLETIRPADAEAVTVEVFARWLHGEVATAVRSTRAGGEPPERVLVVAVRVWESPVAFGGYRAPV